jgi:hypothetical protein
MFKPTVTAERYNGNGPLSWRCHFPDGTDLWYGEVGVTLFACVQDAYAAALLRRFCLEVDPILIDRPASVADVPEPPVPNYRKYARKYAKRRSPLSIHNGPQDAETKS